ncbi:hypothetical protein ACFSQU_15245 [Massilia sp. GCM10020059]|uniref:Uncharacterized protein n=1 Tax=Massilia agrisoli TaxID=2892444 RepID=A0ABS8ISH8_9BURK|nr:hypothetical protein [Massilia agrisoli]MCC6070891.1 hypothetical protein [Massilia agrisoli]
MKASKKEFEPYANEADVVIIGKLMIENRLDRITLAGDVDLTLDRAGLARARELHQLLGAIVARLEASALPEALAPPQVKTVKNPFAG